MTQPHCYYCGQEERYGHNVMCVMNTVDELRADNERLRAALRYGIGAALNELTARNIPLEWSPNGGIGRMLAALGVDATTMTDEARAALEPKP